MKLQFFLLVLFIGFVAPFVSGMQEISSQWAFYEEPFPTWEEVDVAEVSGAPEMYGTARREWVSLPDGEFLRKSSRGGTSLLVNLFQSEKEHTLFLRCGASCYFLQVGLNGELVFDARTTSPEGEDGKKGSHGIPLRVRKGQNVLSLKFYGTARGYSDGMPRYHAAWSECTKDEYEKTRPTSEHFAEIPFLRDASGTISGCTELQRHWIEEVIRNGVDQMTSTVFKEFDRQPGLSAEALARYYEKYPVLSLYDRALDKILHEVSETVVSRDAVVWHLYNMGYVVKTPESCFGIDLHHRRAELLAPILDFVLVTHNHSDHYNLKLLAAMSRAGKPVISNFYPAKGYHRPPMQRELGDVRIESEETDHNASLPKFVCAYRITCGKGSGAPVIYHTGDSCDSRQLHPSGPVDIHIVHPEVGLSVPDAAQSLRPREIWFSHLLEMEHCKPGVYRPVSWMGGYQALDRIRKAGISVTGRFPLWGEKIILP